ncbi:MULTISPECIES: hypothetical protein [Spiroplasma]|uniref:hypothetical protein n=1 Tax=Spiroplasma TaxID=2132 RepID=UPI0018DB6F68|nr:MULTISPECIES: hypothetical protein [Spiroplasma]MBH8623430.1 hypothetical protein [Spiroplasma sp. hyd1]UNF61159.1 hypothetical protein MNU24_04375 [Spiroplasma poulsonii]
MKNEHGYLTQLIEIKENSPIKNDKTGTTELWNGYTFIPVIKLQNGTVKGTKDLSKSKWFKADDEICLKLKPFLIDGNLFYVSIRWDGKLDVITPYTENNNEQDFINKYSNSSTITESNN